MQGFRGRDALVYSRVKCLEGMMVADLVHL